MKNILLIASMAGVSLGAGPALAQSSYSDVMLNQVKSRNSASRYTSESYKNAATSRVIPRYDFSTVNRNVLTGATGGGGQKPFSSYQRSSGISPYLGLVGNNPYTSTTDNYFKLVKPQLDAQRQNDQLTAQNIALQKQLGSVASQAPYSLQGATDRAPTGHASVYFNYGGYYTPVAPRSIRGRR